MSSAKAALESDTKVLSFEAGRKYGIRVNTISAGPLGSRAAKAIGFIDDMIRCLSTSPSFSIPWQEHHLYQATWAIFSMQMRLQLVLACLDLKPAIPYGLWALPHIVYVWIYVSPL